MELSDNELYDNKIYDMGRQVGYIAGFNIGHTTALIQQAVIYLEGEGFSVDEIVDFMQVTTVTKEDVLEIKERMTNEMIRERIDSVLKKHGET